MVLIRSPELGEQTSSLKASSRKSVNFRKIRIDQPKRKEKKNLEEIRARLVHSNQIHSDLPQRRPGVGPPPAAG